MSETQLQTPIKISTSPRTTSSFEGEDPRCFKINQADARVLADPKPKRMSLNGAWLFHWAKNPEARPKDFHQNNFDASAWPTIKVPGLWQLQGYDVPDYLAASTLASSSKIPAINPTDNPVGSYLHHFTLSAAQLNETIFLHFGAIKGTFYLWINGELVSYSQGSATPTEFKINDFVQEGENRLAIAVYGYSASTYLDDQDQWCFSGIYRDVYLYTEPSSYIHDFFARCKFDTHYTNTHLLIDIEIKEPKKNLQIAYALFDGDVLIHSEVQSTCTEYNRYNFQHLITAPKPWSAEAPYLYQLHITLSENNTIISEKISAFGFRQIEIKDKKLLINGRAILLKGVNRPDFDPDTGWTLSEERMQQDLRILKQHNINAIRSSHYPNAARFCELCDIYGMYVMDEPEGETHGGRSKNCPDKHPQWRDALIERVERMVLHNRNHPCIIMWSLGNESTDAKHFLAMRHAMLSLDLTRAIYYEGADDEGQLSDVLSFIPAKSSIDKLAHRDHTHSFYKGITEKFSGVNAVNHYTKTCMDKPIVLCGDAHSTMTSLESFDEFIECFEKYDNFCGGFIWDYCVQALRQYETLLDRKGIKKIEERWYYPDNVVKTKSANNFCANGMVSADRKLQPAIFEVKKAYQSINTKLVSVEQASLEISNHYAFIDLQLFELHWCLLANGEAVGSNIFNALSAPANTTQTITLTFSANTCTDNFSKMLEVHANKQLVLHISYHLKTETLWCEKGYGIAWHEFVLSEYKSSPLTTGQQNIITSEDKEALVIQTHISAIEFNKRTGFIDGINFGEGELLKLPLRPNFDRAPTNYDTAQAEVTKIAAILYSRPWKDAQHSMKLKDLNVDINPDAIIIKTHHSLKHSQNGFHTEIIFYASGLIDFFIQMTPTKDLVRLGYQFVLNKQFNHFSWYGRGPHENYCDRNHGAALGLYAGTVENLIQHYLRPQENGNRCEVRFASLTTHAQQGIVIESLDKQPLSMSVWPWTQDELEKAEHIHELPKPHCTTLNIDHKQQGVGAMPGLLKLKDVYTLKRDLPLSYRFRIMLKI